MHQSPKPRGYRAPRSALRDDAMAEAYRDVHNLLWDVVYDFYGKYGEVYGDPDELFSIVLVAFVRAFDLHDSKKGQFTTFVRWKAFFALKSHIRSHHRQKYHTYPVDPDELQGTPQREDTFAQLVADLSGDAQEVIMLILDTPKDLARVVRRKTDESPPGVLWTLWHFLYGKGWTRRRIRKVFQEIKESL